MNQAMEVYYDWDLDDEAKVDSSLVLTNRALELDDNNFIALEHKCVLMIRKRDAKGLIETVDRLIELGPESPSLLGKKAMCLELLGRPNESRAYYKKALARYHELLEEDASNFDLWVSYLVTLDATGSVLQAEQTLEKVKAMDLSYEQVLALDVYEEQRITKEKREKYLENMTMYWKGLIDYDEVGFE